tara:strand:+ start:521 stop:805 length:285 start_codon:yes stop_codon:yes gene_type:complete
MVVGVVGVLAVLLAMVVHKQQPAIIQAQAVAEVNVAVRQEQLAAGLVEVKLQLGIVINIRVAITFLYAPSLLRAILILIVEQPVHLLLLVQEVV